MNGVVGRHFAGALLAVIAGVACLSVAGAQPMTGPIDLGTVKTGTIDLNPSGSIQSTPSTQPTTRRRAPATSGVAAPKVDIKAFFGSFAGSGVSDGDDVAYFGVTQRDLDVRISAAADGGFTVAWTTVLREGGDPKAPNVRRRATTMTFTPGPRPGLFRATDNGDPLTGDMLSWARISGTTLSIHQFTVLADGRHEIQTYDRTLSGTGMDLVYTRVVQGDRQRRVRGKLVKNAS
jgi:hypothetical protein